MLKPSGLPDLTLRRKLFSVQVATGAKSPVSVMPQPTHFFKGRIAIVLLEAGTKSNLSWLKAGRRHKSLDMRNRVTKRFRASEVPVWR